MRFTNYRLATVTVTVVALGAGAAPALAATNTTTSSTAPTKLVQTIEKLNPLIRQNLDLGTTAKERAGIPKLVANAATCERALTSVGQTPATVAQRSAKREWLTGVHTQMVSDQQISAGLLEELSGQKTIGKRELAVGLNANNRADVDIARADSALEVK